MNKLLNDIFTGKDCHTFDIGRILWAFGCGNFFALSIMHVIVNHDFNPLEYAAALGTLLAAGAGSLALKSKTEPDKNESPNP